jgi:hypothetical protein
MGWSLEHSYIINSTIQLFHDTNEYTIQMVIFLISMLIVI